MKEMKKKIIIASSAFSMVLVIMFVAAFGGVASMLQGNTESVDLISIIVNHHKITAEYQGDEYDDWLPDARDDTYEAKIAMADYFITDSQNNDVKAQYKRKKVVALATFYTYWSTMHKSPIPENFDVDWEKFVACFTGDDYEAEGYTYKTKDSNADKTFSNLEKYLGIKISDDTRGAIASFAKVIKDRVSSSSTVTSVEDVDIDFDSFYYNYDPSGENGKGSYNVCSVNNLPGKAGSGWPYNTCLENSVTGAWNKMICASYASSRYWEVNAGDEAYPLPSNWNACIDKLTNPDETKFDLATSINAVREHSIVEIKYSGGGGHVAFVEAILDDGTWIISECNVTAANQYGFRCREYSSLQDWVSNLGGSFRSALMPKE